MLPETLLTQLQSLPPKQIQVVIDFVEFLHQKYGISTNQEKLPRTLGLYQGMGWISEDFDAPLPDEFWLGGA
ncbi:DUF2281 domain-containing protein [Synechococcus sp. C9]|jgi:archaellum component FlaD/FlaE|uniref:DUF2281 domain-containing protein n=1 Tax=Synechococcus sp. C9 TaxID=102119 RepID=UPI001FF23958|nr:DUF2281 domain-containing protein [Synechococcus sp. C9]